MPTSRSRLSLTAVFEPVEEGWTQARVEEFPEVVTAGPSMADAKELLIDALYEYLLSFRAVGEHGDGGSGVVRQPFQLSVEGLP